MGDPSPRHDEPETWEVVHGINNDVGSLRYFLGFFGRVCNMRFPHTPYYSLRLPKLPKGSLGTYYLPPVNHFLKNPSKSLKMRVSDLGLGVWGALLRESRSIWRLPEQHLAGGPKPETLDPKLGLDPLY